MSRHSKQPRKVLPPAPQATPSSTLWRSDNVRMLGAGFVGAVLVIAGSHFLVPPVRALMVDPVALMQHPDDRGRADDAAASEQPLPPPSGADHQSIYHLDTPRDRGNRGSRDAGASEQRLQPPPGEDHTNYGPGMPWDRDDRGESNDAPAPARRPRPAPGAGYEGTGNRAAYASGLHRDGQGRPYVRWRKCIGSRQHPHCGPWRTGPAPWED